MELWLGKAHIPRLAQSRGLPKLAAYSLSVMDGKRVKSLFPPSNIVVGVCCYIYIYMNGTQFVVVWPQLGIGMTKGTY